MDTILSNSPASAGLFLAVSFFHVASCFFQNNFPQKAAANISKALIMPSLIFFALNVFYSSFPSSVRTADNNAYVQGKSVMQFLTAALAAGWIGDILLIRPISRKKFFAGLSSFFAGHILYLIIIIRQIINSPIRLAANELSIHGAFLFYITGILLCGIYAVSEITLLLLLKKPHGAKGAAVTVYSSMLLLINGCCLFGFFCIANNAFYLFTAGNFLFIISDSLLAYSLFRKNLKYSRQAVMITYIAAQTLLVCGVLTSIL